MHPLTCLLSSIALYSLHSARRFWSLKSGELMHDLDEIHDGQATSVEFSKDGCHVVTCSRDNTVKITDIRTYKVISVLEGSAKCKRRGRRGESTSERVGCSGCDAYCASTSLMRRYAPICVFFTCVAFCAAPFRNLINWNRAVFSPDDQHVLVGGHAGELFFWNVASSRLESVLPGVRVGDGIYGAPTTGSAAQSSSSAAAVAAANAVGEQAISCCDWNRNGRQVMACDQAGNIHQWEPADSK
jgi:WD40 repeat protein